MAFASSSRLRLPLRLQAIGLRYNTSATVPAPPPPVRRRRRETAPRGNVDLIAPPDPVSNIRPIIYASISTRPTSKSSPYSTGEFPYSDRDAALQDLELEWRLRRERVDMMNHRFWASTNAEFNAQLAHRLSLLPPASDPPSAADIQRREDCLSRFYADWQISSRDKQLRWVKVWWRELWGGLKMQARVHVARMMRR